MVEPQKDKPLTAKMLADGLQGTKAERDTEEKMIVLRMTLGQRPVVEFSGFWTGKYIKSALSSISKAYRIRRHKMIGRVHERDNQPPKSGVEGGKGDV